MRIINASCYLWQNYIRNIAIYTVLMIYYLRTSLCITCLIVLSQGQLLALLYVDSYLIWADFVLNYFYLFNIPVFIFTIFTIIIIITITFIIIILLILFKSKTFLKKISSLPYLSCCLLAKNIEKIDLKIYLC